MKATASILLFILCLTSSAAAAFADAEYRWNDKLGRGVVNFFTSPLEIPRNINNVSDEKGPALGWTVGLIAGFAQGIVRAGVGIIETVTFPFDFPDEDKAPLMKPAYAWQGWNDSADAEI